MSHVLLERTNHASDTIYKYQKGKFVMATPDILPLHTDLQFQAGKREEVLGAWDQGLDHLGVNVRYNTDVRAITKKDDIFTLSLSDGDNILAENVVLAIGLQGNINKLRCDGADLPLLQYQLDDPDEYEAEAIVVVGAGDAEIENAVALSRRNTVSIINRRGEFVRVKQGNLSLILGAISKGDIECYYSSSTARIEADAIILETDNGKAKVPCAA